MFERLCKKYDVEPSDFEQEELTMKWIKAPKDKEERRIFNQAIARIHQDKFKRRYSTWSSSSMKNKVGIKLTNSELIELAAFVDFYLNAFRNEVKIFTAAFIQANDLACSAEFLGLPKDEKLSSEDLKMIRLASQLEKNEYYTRIGGNKRDSR